MMFKCHQSSVPVQQPKRLSFEGLNLVGRDAQLATLRRLPDGAMSSAAADGVDDENNTDVGETNTKTPLVLVRGHGGVGKSALLEAAFRDEEKCCFCLGKHEQRKETNQSNTWNEILETLISSLESDLLDRIRIDLEETLEAQHVRQLKGTFPVLDRVFVLQTSNASSDEFESTKVGLAKFIRVVVKNLFQTGRVLVLCLEDLQWSDYTSLAFLLTISAETAMKGIVLVGTYRDNEVKEGENHLVEAFLLSELKERNCDVTDIVLGNLGLEELNGIVVSLLMMKPEKTLELSEIVKRKTDGNVFYALQLFRVLHQENILCYNVDTNEWDWDMEKIAAEIGISENVAELVMLKLNRMPPLSKKVLMIGSCIGAKFHSELMEGVLRVILRKEKAADEENGSEQNDVPPAERDCVDFESMIEDGVLTYRKGFYRFSHDRIEQAAHELFETASEREYTHFVIGRFLRENVIADGDGRLGAYNAEFVKMLCCEQLNLGFSCMGNSSLEILDLLKLNFEAGEIASRRSAFQAAIGFLHSGLSLFDVLEQDPWTEQYALALKIHNPLAAMLNIRGEHDEADEIVATVLRHAHTDREKRWAFVEKVKVLIGQNRMKEAQQFGIKSLKTAGVKFPAGKVGTYHILREFYKVKKKLNKISKSQTDGILQIPECQDEEKRSVVLLMNDIAYASFCLDESDVMAAICLRGLSFSLKHGLSKYTSFCLAVYGCLLGTIGDFDAAYGTGSLATQLAQRFDFSTRAFALVLTCIQHLKDPLHSCLDASLKCYFQALEAGDTEFAVGVLTLYVEIYLFVGMPLQPLVEDLTGYEEQLQKFGHTQNGMIFEVFSQGIDNLRGNARSVYMLNGKFTQEHTFLRDVRDNVVARWAFYFVKLYMAYHLNQQGPEMEQAAEAFWELNNPLEGALNFFRMNHAFLNGMVAMAMAAKRGRKGRYRVIRDRSIALIKRWEKKGIPWVSHMVLILCAEQNRWNPKKRESEIKAGYDAAIRLASATGFVSDCALANERCARYFFDQVNDEIRGNFYLKSAISLYLEWGASAKVKLLLYEFPDASSKESLASET